ncbi:MAG: hypothetical protein EOO10_12300 [Chitinophagaceae bacterium]|nr:MAG: hypothetical protein EOO10_12300 [Chitinophagaceae bacterium]
MNNLTAYRSPIKLLSLSAEESATFSEGMILEAKQKLHSHTPLNEESEAVLYNVNAATWRFHKAIAEQEGLLQFLEEGRFDEPAMQKASFLRYNPAFVQFISGPFAVAFQKASATICQGKDVYPTLLKLIDYASFILPQHEVFAFQTINQYLAQQTRPLALLSWEQFIVDEEQLAFVFSGDWTALMNSLPVACAAQRDEMIKALLNILKRFRLDASTDYLKAICGRLHKLKMEPAEEQDLQEYETGFHLPKPVKNVATKPATPRWPLYAGGGTLLLVAAVFLLFHLTGKKNRRPEQPEDKYMESVTYTPASDQLNSSVNERNLKGFFFLSAKQENSGRPMLLETGATPLPGVTKLPSGEGNSTLTVRNETGADALLFYFGSDNPLVNKNSRIVSVYIRRGEEYRCRFQPDFGRFNFLFGQQWVKMDRPVPFPLQTSTENEIPFIGKNDNGSDVWIIPDFFQNVAPQQPYLTHDLLITNIEQQTVSTGNNLVYTLLNKKDNSKGYGDEGFAEIVLEEKNGEFTVRAKSSLYVYRSFPTF